MQQRNFVQVFTHQLQYILILNWDRQSNTITYLKDKYFVSMSSPATTTKLKIHNNKIIIGDLSFKRSYLKNIKNVNKISKESTSRNDSSFITRLQICENHEKRLRDPKE